ncbi:MAG TPA: glycosyltransferase [Steroidobacteraceae bacterium]|nr:glycosyltransferase [Steroidobacteraceae bacterium]
MSVRIAHVIQSIDPKFGGPSAVVMQLARAQAKLGAEVSIVTVSSENERRCFDDWIARLGAETNLRLVTWPGGWIHNLRVDAQVRELLERHDVVHVHGVWDSLVTRCLMALRSASARLVLAPHGMLTRWSLGQKAAKKTLVWNLWMRSALTRVDRFHVLNDGEGQELRALLPGACVGVLPNGTDLPAPAERGAARESRPYILFLARLHPVKGPERLVDAFTHAVSAGSLPADLGLVMAGPDFGMLAELRERAARLGIADRVTFPGAVFGAQKESLLNGALALCQPSRHEGFSLTLLEALAHGVPVITTPESNLPALLAVDGGLVVDGDVESLSAALIALVGDPARRERMGAAGRDLVARHYTWDQVASQSLALYGHRGGAAPDANAPDHLSAARTH